MKKLKLDVSAPEQGILKNCLEVLEYVTYHDGRYCQEQSRDWQSQAQKLVHRIAGILKVKPYADFGPK